MKNLLSLLLIAVLALTFAVSVSADVIFEPSDDFYKDHSSECPLLERYFVVSEATYSVNEPGSELVASKLSTGEKLYISNTYTDADDVVWGLIQYSDASGWVPMGYLEVQYDDVSFNEEFGTEFNKETDDLRIDAGDLNKLVFWDFPGSENHTEFEPWDDSYRDISFSHSYTDTNGTVWGYVGYFYGMRGWINVSDPDSTDAPFVLERENKNLYSDSKFTDNVPSDVPFSPIWIAVILVAAVCGGTAVLIVALTKKKTD